MTDLGFSISGLIKKDIDVWKMNEEIGQTDPATELQLDLAYLHQYNENILNSDSGAGANAGSMVDIAFVTTDPLSELVWSPHKGLSLKCADFSFGNRKPSMLRGVGPSNMDLALAESITAEKSCSEKLVQDRILSSHSKNECDSKDISTGSDMGDVGASLSRSGHILDKGISCEAEEINSTAGVSFPCFKQEEDLPDIVVEEVADPIITQMVEAAEMIENKSLVLPGHVNERNADVLFAERDVIEPVIARPEKPTDLTGENSVAGCGKIMMGIDDPQASKAHMLEECQPSGSQPQNPDPSSSRPLEKRESTAENELQKLNNENGCDKPRKIEAADSLRHQPVEKFQSIEESVAADCSPSNSRIHKKRKKGKKKALFDGYGDGRNSNDKGDSYESVESCNSAEIFCRGKKIRNEQQLVVERNRVENQIHDTTGSTSVIGKDSSFMIWISNMMKGFPKSIPEKESSLALTHAHSDNEHNDSNKESLIWKKNQDLQHQRMGFQSIFRSSYGLSTKGQHLLSHNAHNEEEERSEDYIKQAYDADATPLAFHKENSNSCGQVILTSKNLNKSTLGNKNNESVSRNSADAAIRPNACIHESQMAVPGDRRAACNAPPIIGEGKFETSSSSSMPRKRKSVENIDPAVPSEVKTNLSLGNGGKHLKSLWITRLSKKSSQAVENLDSEDQNINDRLQCGSHILCSQNQDDFTSKQKEQTSDEPLSILKGEIHRCTLYSECTTGFDRIEGHLDQSLANKFNPMLPATRSGRSVMASVFARRLDALKHIPSNIREIGTDEKIICFFCGSRGHHLQDCSKIAESEVVEHLSKIPSLFDGAVEVSCLCIRCFQLNHWAVSCPQGRGQYHPESNCSLVNHFGNGDKQPSNSGLNTKFLIGDSSKPQPPTCIKNHINDPELDDHNLRSKPVHNKTSEQLRSIEDSNERFMASNCMEKKETEIVRFTTIDVRGVFDVIKKLQLSRTDILKWMNSNMSLAKLEGLFLRLRLGKWEKGYGGTGYHVAFVTGTQNARNSISVNVGGVECLTQSQSISNHDFHEEELKAWWHATSKDRNQDIVEADLKAKLKKKRLLGL